MTTQLDPSKIMQIGMGFWASKTLLAAVELELFTVLSSGPKNADEIQKNIGIHRRGLYDFLDTLTALGFLQREGLKESATYWNSLEVNAFLVKGKPQYLGSILQMANHRLYGYWGSLEEALKTGLPQNEFKYGTSSIFENLYSDQTRLVEFLRAMSSIQMGNFLALARKFDFSPYYRVADMGGANGCLAIVLAKAFPHLSCITFDLPAVESIARENINSNGVADKVLAKSGDFFKDPFPRADVITMGNILHDWGEEEKLILLRKAYNALPGKGIFIAVENIIDNQRQENVFGLMMSLNMLIETKDGFDYTANDFHSWAIEAGFRDTKILPLEGPTSAAIAFK